MRLSICLLLVLVIAVIAQTDVGHSLAHSSLRHKMKHQHGADAQTEAEVTGVWKLNTWYWSDSMIMWWMPVGEDVETDCGANWNYFDVDWCHEKQWVHWVNH